MILSCGKSLCAANALSNVAISLSTNCRRCFKTQCSVHHWVHLFFNLTVLGWQSCFIVGWDSVVGSELLRAGLYGDRIESRWGPDLPHPSRTALGPTLLPVQWVPGLFPGGKTARAWRWLPTSSSTEVKEWVDLYLCFSSGTSWPVVRWGLPYLFYLVSLTFAFLA
jgi:hypothetical protein